METLHTVAGLYAAIIIRGMFFSVLTVMLAASVFKQINAGRGLAVLRILILVYATACLLSLIIQLLTEEGYASRASGRYWWSFWLMEISVAILPFLLITPKFRKSFAAYLIISILLNIGVLFERFVIIMTSLHRDYASSSDNMVIYAGIGLCLVAVQGIFIGLLSLIAGHIVHWTKKSIFAKSIKTTTQQ